MNIEQIIAALLSRSVERNSHLRKAVESAIDNLPHSDRLEIQDRIRDTPAPRNLYYDYKKQVWI
jgi:hypothetical protein